MSQELASSSFRTVIDGRSAADYVTGRGWSRSTLIGGGRSAAADFVTRDPEGGRFHPPCICSATPSGDSSTCSPEPAPPLRQRLGVADDPDMTRTRTRTDDPAELWASYSRTRSLEDRNRLVEHYLPLANGVVARMISDKGMPPGDRQDLQADAAIGLIDAVARFEPERGLRFGTYAPSRIRGAVLDAMRQRDQVPRSVRTGTRRLDDAAAQLLAEHGRAPTDAETARHLGVGIPELRRMRYFGVVAASSISLDGDRHDDGYGVALADRLPDASADPSDIYSSGAEIAQALAAAIDTLSVRQKTILALAYVEGLNQRQTGAVLGSTGAHINILQTEAVAAIIANWRMPIAM